MCALPCALQNIKAAPRPCSKKFYKTILKCPLFLFYHPPLSARTHLLAPNGLIKKLFLLRRLTWNLRVWTNSNVMDTNSCVCETKHKLIIYWNVEFKQKCINAVLLYNAMCSINYLVNESNYSRHSTAECTRQNARYDKERKKNLKRQRTKKKRKSNSNHQKCKIPCAKEHCFRFNSVLCVRWQRQNRRNISDLTNDNRNHRIVAIFLFQIEWMNGMYVFVVETQCIFGVAGDGGGRGWRAVMWLMLCFVQTLFICLAFQRLKKCQNVTKQISSLNIFYYYCYCA